MRDLDRLRTRVDRLRSKVTPYSPATQDNLPMPVLFAYSPLTDNKISTHKLCQRTTSKRLACLSVLEVKDHLKRKYRGALCARWEAGVPLLNANCG